MRKYKWRDESRIEIVTKMLEEFPSTRKAVIDFLCEFYRSEISLCIRKQQEQALSK